MSLKTLAVLSVILAALAFVPTGAHLFELPHKMQMSADEYRVAQQIYRGWSLFGIVIALALIGALALGLKLRFRHRSSTAAWVGLVSLFATQIVFWAFTFPVNRETDNWTVLPPNWTDLRAQWEYSHASSAILNFIAVAALAVAATHARGATESPRRG